MASASAQSPDGDRLGHPLDPLTAKEYSTVVAGLRDGGHATFATLYPLVTLKEPTKAEVLAWEPGSAFPRLAHVVAKSRSRTIEAVVDAKNGDVLSVDELEGVQAGFLLSEEWASAQRIVFSSEAWRQAVRKRGITNLDDVICIPNSVGNHGAPEEQERRLVKVVCYGSADTANFWGRPIEGLVAVVDLNSHEIVRIEDTGVIPVPKSPVGFDRQSVATLRPPVNAIIPSQQDGPTFEVDGHVVQWQKWKFHLRVDPRLGPVVSTVTYRDGDRERSIIYQASLSELFVPYMDPGGSWYFRTYLDAGEYGIGRLAVELERGVDCPVNARYFDAVFLDDWGDPYVQNRAICLFERYNGGVAWRHSESVTGRTEIRKQTDLVLRLVSAIGNYDYTFDWVFRQDGSISVAVGASGIEQVKAVTAETVSEVNAVTESAFGRFVAPGIVAVNHDHFFCFRIDFDVDGRYNSFFRDDLRTRTLGQDSPRQSVWVVDSRALAREGTARLKINLEQPALWRVVNPNVLGPIGYPVSYQLKPGSNAVSLLRSDDLLQKRAGFTDFHLWVTRYDADERYAAGSYPNQSKGDDGLRVWSSADRSIENTDIVLWYTMGFHHVVRAEDWPVLPTAWSEFDLRPFDFFDSNPALDLPE